MFRPNSPINTSPQPSLVQSQREPDIPPNGCRNPMQRAAEFIARTMGPNIARLLCFGRSRNQEQKVSRHLEPPASIPATRKPFIMEIPKSSFKTEDEREVFIGDLRSLLERNAIAEAIQLLSKIKEYEEAHFTYLFEQYINANVSSDNYEDCYALIKSFHDHEKQSTSQLSYYWLEQLSLRQNENNTTRDFDKLSTLVDQCDDKVIFPTYFVGPIQQFFAKSMNFEDKQALVDQYQLKVGDQAIAIDLIENVNAQKKDRDPKLYASLLHIDTASLQKEEKVLLIGGGCSSIQQEFSNQLVTNYDRFHLNGQIVTDVEAALHPVSLTDSNSAIANYHIRGDFCGELAPFSEQDQAWCLFSLPMYASSIESTQLFFKNAIQSVKEGGVIRIFPFAERKPLTTSFNKINQLIYKELEKFDQKVLEKMQENSDAFDITTYQEKFEHKLAFSSKLGKSTGSGVIITIKSKEQALEVIESILTTSEKEVVTEHDQYLLKPRKLS